MYASSGYQFFKTTAGKVYFRKTRHVCSLNKKGHILINLRQFVRETVLRAYKFKGFGVIKCPPPPPK